VTTPSVIILAVAGSGIIAMLGLRRGGSRVTQITRTVREEKGGDA